MDATYSQNESRYPYLVPVPACNGHRHPRLKLPYFLLVTVNDRGGLYCYPNVSTYRAVLAETLNAVFRIYVAKRNRIRPMP